jgi:ketosteroid isomerase-like protein
MAAYVDAVDRGADGPAIARLYTPDGVFEGLGELAGPIGRNQGRDAIARRLAANREHLTFSVHFFADESITVDGDRATGSWIYLQPAVHDGRRLWIAGRWHNAFTRIDGEWCIARNACEAIFVAPYATGWHG